MRPSLAGYAPRKQKFQAVTALLLSICVLNTPCTAVGQSEDGVERVEEGATAVAVSGPLLSSLSTRLALNASAEQLAAGVPACKAVRVAQDSKYLQWLLSASVVPGNEPQTGGAAPLECASMAVRVRVVPLYVGFNESGVLDCSLEGLHTYLGELPSTDADGVPYLGYTCEHSDVYVVATTTCLGVVELDVSMELYDVAQNDTACSALKFMYEVDERQTALLVLYVVVMLPFIVCTVISACLFCSGSCCHGMHAKLCCCLQVSMGYAQKTEFVRLLNVGGHSRGFTLNLIAAGVIWLQGQLWLATLAPPPGVTGVEPIAGLEVSVADSIGQDIDAVLLQFSGFLNWISKMILCCIIGYAVYGSLMMNYTLRGQDKAVTILLLSCIFLACMNAFVALLMVDSFWLIEFFKLKQAYAYFYIALIFHTLVADFYAFRLLFAPKRFHWNHQHSLLKLRAPKRGCGGFCGCCRRAWVRFGGWIGEDPSFRYSPWMLAAVMAAFHVLMFSFLSSLFRLIDISKCLQDVDACLTGAILDNFFFIPTEQIIRAVRGSQDIKADTALASSMEVIYNVTAPLITNLQNVCTTTASIPPDVLDALVAAEPGMNASVAMLQQSLSTICAADLTDAASLVQSQLDLAISSVFGATGPLAAKIAGLTATAEAAYEQYLVINDLMQELADSFLIGAALGYSIGLVCGAYALLLTLAQYKILVKKIKRDAIVRLFTGDAHRETGFSVEEIRRKTDLRHSVYFTGILVSTAFIQLQVAGVVITAIVAVLFYRPFWTMFVARFWGYIVSIVVVVIANVVFMKKWLGSRVTDGRNIKTMRGWLAYYIIFSFAQVVFGLLLAFTRIILLLVTSLIALNRLDINLFTIGRGLDNGYRSFMGMAAMVEAMHAKERRCWKQIRYIVTTPGFKQLREAVAEKERNSSSSGVSLPGYTPPVSHRSATELPLARPQPRSEKRSAVDETESRGSVMSSRREELLPLRQRVAKKSDAPPLIAPPLYGLPAADSDSEFDDEDGLPSPDEVNDPSREEISVTTPGVANPLFSASLVGSDDAGVAGSAARHTSIGDRSTRRSSGAGLLSGGSSSAGIMDNNDVEAGSGTGRQL